MHVLSNDQGDAQDQHRSQAVILEYTIEYNINGELRADAPASLEYPEGLIMMDDTDEVQEILGDEKAQVGISMSHKLGGPHYSSVSIHASVRLRCGQNAELIERANVVALDIVSTFVGEYSTQCYDHLLNVLNGLPE